MDAKRQEVITRLKNLETEFKGDMRPSCHGDIHEPQESSDTRSVIKTQLKFPFILGRGGDPCTLSNFFKPYIQNPAVRLQHDSRSLLELA